MGEDKSSPRKFRNSLYKREPENSLCLRRWKGKAASNAISIQQKGYLGPEPPVGWLGHAGEALDQKKAEVATEQRTHSCALCGRPKVAPRSVTPVDASSRRAILSEYLKEFFCCVSVLCSVYVSLESSSPPPLLFFFLGRGHSSAVSKTARSTHVGVVEVASPLGR
jgi:hypothetical protein